MLRIRSEVFDQAAFKRRIKELTEENAALRKQLEVAYGQIAVKDRV